MKKRKPAEYKQEVFTARYSGESMKLICHRLKLNYTTVISYFGYGKEWIEEYREFKRIMDRYVDRESKVD